MVDGQQQRVAVSAHVKTAHDGLQQKSLEDDLCWFGPPLPPPTTRPAKGLNWTEAEEKRQNGLLEVTDMFVKISNTNRRLCDIVQSQTQLVSSSSVSLNPIPLNLLRWRVCPA